MEGEPKSKVTLQIFPVLGGSHFFMRIVSSDFWAGSKNHPSFFSFKKNTHSENHPGFQNLKKKSS
jgi:hypothetical protein